MGCEPSEASEQPFQLPVRTAHCKPSLRRLEDNYPYLEFPLACSLS